MDKIVYGPYLKNLLFTQFKDFIENIDRVTFDSTLVTFDSTEYTFDND